MILADPPAFHTWLLEHQPGPVVLDIETFGKAVSDDIHGMGLKYWLYDGVEPIYVTAGAFARGAHVFRNWLKGMVIHNHSLSFDLARLDYHFHCIPWRDIVCHDVRNYSTLCKNAKGDITGNGLDILARELDPDSGKDTEIYEWLSSHGLRSWQYAWAPVEMTARYCINDLRLVELTEPVWHVRVQEMEMGRPARLEDDLIPCIAEMQARGMRLDMDFVHQGLAHLSSERNAYLGALKKYADINWSPNSKELEQFLTSGLGIELIEIPRFNKEERQWEGKVSIDKAARDMYCEAYPEHARMFTLIGRLQRANKVLDYYRTYARDQVEGRIHPTFNSLGAKTGRGSSSGPNFQNLSHKQPDESVYYEVKNCILADEGYHIRTADYSQAELRLLLHYIRHYSDEIQPLIEQVEQGADTHLLTAALMLRKDPKDVTKEERQRGKTMNFAQIYGQGINSLAKNLGISKEEAKRLQQAYYDGLKGLAELKQRIRGAALRNGHVRTIFGRKVHVPKDRTYVALNYADQGSVGEGTKLAMLELWHDPPCQDHRILFQVHDDIPQQIPVEADGPDIPTAITERMLRPWSGLSIKFDVDVSDPQERWAA